MANFTQHILPIFISLLVCCCVSPQYQDASLPSQLNLAQSVKDKYYIDSRWWKTYQDKQLNQLIEVAIANNTDLAKSAQVMRKAMYQVNLSEPDLYPTLSEDTSITTNRKTYLPQNGISRERRAI